MCFKTNLTRGGAISQFFRHILTVSASFHTESATTILHVSAMITSHCRRRGSAFDQPTCRMQPPFELDSAIHIPNNIRLAASTIPSRKHLSSWAVVKCRPTYRNHHLNWTVLFIYLSSLSALLLPSFDAQTISGSRHPQSHQENIFHPEQLWSGTQTMVRDNLVIFSEVDETLAGIQKWSAMMRTQPLGRVWQMPSCLPLD